MKFILALSLLFNSPAYADEDPCQDLEKNKQIFSKLHDDQVCKISRNLGACSAAGAAMVGSGVGIAGMLGLKMPKFPWDKSSVLKQLDEKTKLLYKLYTDRNYHEFHQNSYAATGDLDLAVNGGGDDKHKAAIAEIDKQINSTIDDIDNFIKKEPELAKQFFQSNYSAKADLDKLFTKYAGFSGALPNTPDNIRSLKLLNLEKNIEAASAGNLEKTLIKSASSVKFKAGKIALFAVGGALIEVILFASEAKATACSEPGMPNMNLDSSCNPIYEPNEKTVGFLTKTPEEAAQEMKTNPNLCRYNLKLMNTLEDENKKIVENIESIDCSTSGRKISLKNKTSLNVSYRSDGSVSKIFKEGPATQETITQLNFDNSGNISQYCHNKDYSQCRVNIATDNEHSKLTPEREKIHLLTNYAQSYCDQTAANSVSGSKTDTGGNPGIR